jgi:hypothetical protein
MPWYKAGTVSVVLNSNTVIGTGTAFIANSRVGDAFRGPDGAWYEVTNIASDTALSISPNYQGAIAAAGAYALAPMQGYVKDSADALRSLVNQFGGVLAVLGTTPTQVGVRAALNLTNTDGVSEGTINKYLSNAGVLGTVLTGLSFPTVAAIVATDTILSAFGKLQASLNSKAAKGANSDITALVNLSTAITVAQGGTGGSTAAAARIGLGLKTAATADIAGTVSQSGGVPTGAIIERGSNANGEWTMFADGTMICTGIKDLGVQSFVAIGGVFYQGAFSGLPFPRTFVGTVRTSIGVVSAGGVCWASQGSSFSSTSATANFFVLSPGSAANSLGATYMAIGRWF